MMHDLQRRNHTTMFNAIDRNRDGVLSWEDHLLILDGFAAETKLPKGSPPYVALRDAIKRNWDELKTQADLNEDDVVDLGEWLAHYERMIGTAEGYEIAIKAISEMILGLADDDRDGKLTLGNYTMLLRVYGVDGERAAEAFRKVDTNGDGIVTTDELMRAVDQFVRSANPTDPGHWLLGPPAA